MPIYTPGKLTLSRIQQYPIVIGESFGGGYFAGYISHTADGSPTHALIVASRQQIGGKYAVSGNQYTGSTTDQAWGAGTAASNTVTTGVGAGQTLTDYNARKDFDGAVTIAVMKANTYGLSNATYPAAYFIDNINASGGFNGYTDWYLPSRFELDIAYFNLKPNTQVNDTGVPTNNYSVPLRTRGYGPLFPSQTSLTSFREGGAESIPPDSTWSSTEASSSGAWIVTFNSGGHGNVGKAIPFPVRAFRKIAF
tara:strand:- start:78 stop:833 length:756 start_codon:yes stop_codon:yes gene_type:complete